MPTVVTIAAVTWLLIVGESVLRPFATALLLTLVLSATSERIVALLPRSWRRGKTITRLASIVGIALVLLAVGVLVADALVQLRRNLPLYAENLDFVLAEVQALFGTGEALTIANLVGQIDFQSLALDLAASTAGYLSLSFVIVLYVIFIFVEASAVGAKISSLSSTAQGEMRLRTIAGEIKRAIDDVLGVQVLVGIVQAVPTFMVLALIGVDASVLWAVLVFFFSFVPTIGTVFGIGVPSLMTLLQFMQLDTFLVVLVVTGVVQVFGTNILMPRLMSRSLNVSSLFVLVGVFAGGAVWGIVGAIIAVPVLTIAMIVCAKVPSLRPVAVILSANGEVPELVEPVASGTDPDPAGRAPGTRP